MKAPGSWFFPGWETLCQALAAETDTPTGRIRAQHLTPAFVPKEVEQLHRLSQEAEKALDLWPTLTGKALQALLNNLEKPAQPLPLQQIQACRELLQTLREYKQALQPRQKHLPALWQRLQSLSWSEDLERGLANNGSLDQKQRLLSQRWRQVQAMAQMLAEWDLLSAKIKLGRKYRGQWAAFSQAQEMHLPGWKELLPLLKAQASPLGDLHWPNHTHTWILSGQHGSGKTALIQNLGLAVCLHQSGLALPTQTPGRLPVFTGLQWVREDLPLRTQLQALQQVFKRAQNHPLLLLDNPLAGSNPGESYALLRALLQELVGSPCKVLISTHNSLLGRLSQDYPGIVKMALEKQGPNWQLKADQWAPSELLNQAQRAGWPSQVLQQAEKRYKELKGNSPKTTAPKTAPSKAKMPVVAPSALAGLSPGVKTGAWVYVETVRAYGELLSLPDPKGEVAVLLDGKKWTFSARYVRLSSHRKEKKGDTTGVQILVHSVASQFCDLHNLRVHEALSRLDKFLDTAVHAGLRQVSVIHGKGEGVLRQAVHTHLKDSPYVQGFRLEDYGRGDTGVTVVDLN